MDLDAIPNRMDLTQLFALKGGKDIVICVGTESEAVQCKGENTEGVKCTSLATISCEKGSSAISCSGIKPAVSINPEPDPVDPCQGKEGGSLSGKD